MPAITHHQQHSNVNMSTPSTHDTTLEILTSTILRQASTHAARAASVTALREKGIRCCCESDCCAFFIESTALLEQLEVDVQTAASVGKLLLERHDKALEEAREERERLKKMIDECEQRAGKLEDENDKLERENARGIEENRRLLERLEEMNLGLAGSEGRVRELQGDLDAVHAELSRVAHAAARTEVLEAQLAALESEQTELKRNYARTKEDERAAVNRWREAERKISELTAEVEHIEREHRMEKARAQNLLERLEKRNLAGKRNRLSDGEAAQFPSALQERTVMSQFMRDILAENNALQSGLAELRDMLLTSQEEVGALREQLLQFSRAEGSVGVPLSREIPLAAEGGANSLGLAIGGMPTGVAPELHFHHHVHKEKPVMRRARRRVPKNVLTTDYKRMSIDSPIAGVTSPTSPGPSIRPQRWSQLSTHTRSSSGRGVPPSFPGSPQSMSTFRDSSIFDRGFDVGEYSTRPSTADTEWDSASMNKWAGTAVRSRRSPRDSTGGPPFSILCTEEIPENIAEDEEGHEEELVEGQGAELHRQEEQQTDDASAVDNSRQCDACPPPRSSSPGARSVLRKSASHESLLVPASTNYPLSMSFTPTSPAAIAAAAASKAQAHSSRGGPSSTSPSASAAYNHLLLAGSSIRGKGLTRSSTSTSTSSMGKLKWFTGWGWGAAPFSTGFRITAPSEDGKSTISATDSASPSLSRAPSTIGGSGTPISSANRSSAVSIASLNLGKGKASAAPVVAVPGVDASGPSMAGTSPAKSAKESGFAGIGGTDAGRTVSMAMYRSMVDEQLLKESLMESMQM